MDTTFDDELVKPRAAWSNLAFFYASYRWSPGLIRLGRIDGSFDPLLVRGKFPLRIERIS